MGGLDNLKDQVEQMAAAPLALGEETGDVEWAGDVEWTGDVEQAGDEVSRPGRDAGHRTTGDMYTEILLKGR